MTTDLAKPIRHVDEEVLSQVRKLPCMACSDSDLEAARATALEQTGESHPHHLISRGAGGGDYAWNCIPLCKPHHRQVHSIALSRFASQFKTVSNWLQLAGWSTDRGFWYPPRE